MVQTDLDWSAVLERSGPAPRGSAIRDLLAVTERPDVISFAGGLPAPELFPAGGLRAAFDAVLREDALRQRVGPDSALLYTVPTFQNPSGGTMTLERRRELLAATRDLGLPVIEDDPYSELRYEGEPVPALRALAGSEHVIHLGTFSKVLSPGLRLGWAVAPRPVMERLVLAK